MAKQLLIYESAVPLSPSRHADVSVDLTGDYGFSADINAVPLMAAEFTRAATEYAIVFGNYGDEVFPAAVLGSKGSKNLFLADDARWQARYVPAFIRRYPFVLAAGADRKTLVLCIDETHAGVNRQGKGQRLFGDDGKPSEYARKVLQFLQEYQVHFERTRQFCRQLKALDLLEPMQATITTTDAEPRDLGSFLAVSRRKLQALDDPTLVRLVRSDALELIHLHLYALRNFDQVKDRLLGALSDAGSAAAAVKAS